MSRNICYYFQQGRCKFGDRCRFVHPGAVNGSYDARDSVNRQRSGYSDAYGTTTNRFQQLTSGNTDFKQQAKSSNAPNARDSTPSQIIELLVEGIEQWEKGKMWLYTCVSAAGDIGCLPGFEDLSPEELRLKAYEAQKDGTSDKFRLWIDQLSNEILQKRTQLKNMNAQQRMDLVNVIETLKRNSNNTSASTSTQGNTTTLFGKPVINTTATQSGGLFGKGTSQTSSVFGATTSTSPTGASVFGGGTAAGASPGASVFGGGSASGGGSVFGGQAQPTGSSVFGGQTQPTGGSVFGGQTQPPGSSVFGGQAQSSRASVFGGSSNSGASVFGNQPQATGSSVFGSQPHTQTTGASVFGGQNQATGSSVFGGQSSGGSVFGGQNQDGASVFGGQVVNSAAGGDSSSIATPGLFGKPGTFGTSSLITSTPIVANPTSTAPLTQSSGPPQPPNSTQSITTQSSNDISTHGTNSRHLPVYTPLDKLTPEERASFQAPKFVLGKIPLCPPPREFV